MRLIGHLGDKQCYVTIIYLVRETLKFECVTESAYVKHKLFKTENQHISLCWCDVSHVNYKVHPVHCHLTHGYNNTYAYSHSRTLGMLN